MAPYEITLRDYWRIMRRRKGIVIFTVALLGFFSFLITHIWKPEPIYKAVSKVQIASPESLASLNAQYMGFGGGGSDQLETQRSIITSFPVIRRTAEYLRLFEGSRTEEDSTAMVLGLQAHIKTSQEGYTNIIGIEATGSQAEAARELADAVAVVFAEYKNAQKNEKSKQHRIFVEQQRERARLALALAEDSVQAYREQQQLVSIDAQAGSILSQINTAKQTINQLDQDLRGIETMLTEIDRNQALSKRTMQGASRTRVGEAFISLTQQLNNLQLERSSMLVQYTEDHPKVQQVQAKVVELIRNLKDELRARLQVLAHDLEAARVLLARAQLEYDQLPIKGQELGRLQREVNLRQQVVGVLEEEYQNARIREADRIEEVTVLQRAVTPSAPTNPQNPAQRALVGVILGLVLGIVFAVVAESLDTSIGTVEDVQEYTATQVVGIIPSINLDDVRASLRRRNLDISDERTVQRKAQLVAFFDPQSTMSESYRTLRTNIEFVTVEKGVRCLMVTSSMLREGKSTTIANLAMTMAQLGKRTLLVDCDLRKPTMAKLFGLDNEPGMTEVIVGNYDWHQVIRTVTDIVTGGMGMEDILQTQGISNLHIIPSGSIPPNPAELLNSRRMTEFIAQVREAYDVVLFDSPPALQVTDAAILGKKVDGALMVYKVGEVPRASLKRSTSLLKSVQIDLLGIVLNGLHAADVSMEYQDLGYRSDYRYSAESKAQPRTLREKAEDRFRKLKKRLSGAEDADLGDEEEDEDEDERQSRAGGAVVSVLSLLLVGLGLAWQSGYLAKPLGLVPVLREYPPREAQVITPVPAKVFEETAPPPQDTAAVAVAASVPVTEEEGIAAAEEEMVFTGKSEPEPAEAPTAQAPAPEAEEPPPPARVAPRTGPQPYAIHVASYPPDSKWAPRTLAQLRARNLDAFFSPVVVKGQPYRRLLVGSFSSANEARRRGRQLQEQGVLEKYRVLRLPYAVELSDGESAAQAHSSLRELGPKEALAYVQPLSESAVRVLAGAFENAAAAQHFLEREAGGGRVVPR
ncbi:MAG: AAA family ATPase [Candidatus Handelsmanbacteria bacterium]|nr:AAA family ATPase [Candidatus Handelsmanbacteria bacterium]